MSCTTTPDLRQREYVGRRVGAICGCWATLLLPFAYAGYVQQGPVLCPLRALFGLPCPGCGMTRAFCALSQFEWLSAVELNALCIPLVLVLFITPVVALVELARGKPCRFYSFLYSSRVAWCCGGVTAAYHVGRLVWWAHTGALMNDYLKSSWGFQMLNWLMLRS